MVESLPSPDSASEMLRAFDSNAAIRTRVDDIHRSLIECSQEQGEWENLLRDVIATIPKLNSREYRSLVGLLNTGRKGASSPMNTLLRETLKQQDSSGTLHDLVNSLLKLHALLNRSEEQPPDQTMDPSASPKRRTTDGRFAEQALLLVRSVHSFGINVPNPSWMNTMPQSFDATETLTFQPDFDDSHDCVEVRPHGKCTSIIEYYEKMSHAGRIQWIRHTAELRDGSSLLIGRKLELPVIFGRAVSIPPIQPDCDVGDNDHFSRAGILIVRYKGRLYLFDRGCRVPIVFNQRNGMSGTYAPESRKDDKGHWKHGHTVMEGPPLKRPDHELAPTMHDKRQQRQTDDKTDPAEVKRHTLPDIISEQHLRKPWYKRILPRFLGG